MKALVPLLLAAGVISVVAHVGDRTGELESRYGERFTVGTDEFDPAGVVFGFDKDGTSKLRARGFQVTAVIGTAGRCQELVYEKSFGTPLDQRELQGILISNSMGMAWEPVVGNTGGPMFLRADGAVAFLSAVNCLEVMTPERAQLRKIAVST